MFAIKAQQRQKGAALISAIFLITALAILAALMTKLTQFSSNKSVKEWNATQALYAAESAVSAATYDIIHIQNNSCTARTNISVSIDSNSSATYSVTCNNVGLTGQTINHYQIIATGKAGGGDYQAQRTLSIQFVP